MIALTFIFCFFILTIQVKCATSKFPFYWLCSQMNACAKFPPPPLGSYRDALQTALPEIYRVREYRDSSYSHQYYTSSILNTTYLDGQFLTPEHLKHKCFSLVMYRLASIASQSLKLSTHPNSMIPRTKRTRQLVITTSSS